MKVCSLKSLLSPSASCASHSLQPHNSGDPSRFVSRNPLRNGPTPPQRLRSHVPAATHRRPTDGPFLGERRRAPHPLETVAAHLREFLDDGQRGTPGSPSLLPSAEESVSAADARHGGPPPHRRLPSGGSSGHPLPRRLRQGPGASLRSRHLARPRHLGLPTSPSAAWRTPGRVAGGPATSGSAMQVPRRPDGPETGGAVGHWSSLGEGQGTPASPRGPGPSPDS